MGLYWIRPFYYANLDERNRSYLLNSALSDGISNISNLKQLPSAEVYLQVIRFVKENFNKENFLYQIFPKLSYAAWKAASPKDKKQPTSTASFLKWFAPLINALKKLGGSGTPEEARKQIISDLKLSDDIVNETRGKTNVKKFDNEVAFARNYLVYDGYIDNSMRGKWTLTEKGRTAHMDDEIASQLFIKWADIFKQRRYLVIEGLLLTEQEGSHKLARFIDDQKMHRLFEKFVLEYYRKHFPQFHASASHIDWNVDDGIVEFLPTMKSDITLYYADKILIIDTKYYGETMQTNSFYNSRTLHSNNLYQIFTYVKNKDVTNSGSVSGILLYAKTEEEMVPENDFLMSRNRIGVKILDMNTDFSNIAKQLNILAERYLITE